MLLTFITHHVKLVVTTEYISPLSRYQYISPHATQRSKRKRKQSFFLLLIVYVGIFQVLYIEKVGDHLVVRLSFSLKIEKNVLFRVKHTVLLEILQFC